MGLINKRQLVGILRELEFLYVSQAQLDSLLHKREGQTVMADCFNPEHDGDSQQHLLLYSRKSVNPYSSVVYTNCCRCNRLYAVMANPLEGSFEIDFVVG